MDPLSQLPLAAQVGIGVLILVQLSLQVWALVDLWKRDRVLGGRKWVWALVILLAELPGPIIYLAVGRNVPPQAVDPLASARKDDGDRAERAADVLYGKH